MNVLHWKISFNQIKSLKQFWQDLRGVLKITSILKDPVVVHVKALLTISKIEIFRGPEHRGFPRSFKFLFVKNYVSPLNQKSKNEKNCHTAEGGVEGVQCAST